MIFNKDDTESFINFKSGDDLGYERLFKRFYQPLCLFAMQYKITREEAEEVIQDVLLQLWYKRKDFDSLQRMSAFLYVSTRNATLNILDKNRRLLTNQEAYLKQDLMDIGLNPEQFQKMVYAETVSQLHHILKKLPNRCAQVIALLYLEGYSVPEVVAELNITAATVYVQKKKGLDLLREILKSQDYFLISLMLAGFFKN